MHGPNEIASAVLYRVLTDEGEEWRVRVKSNSQVTNQMKAITALRSGILVALEKVRSGELPAAGNGEVETLVLPVRAPEV